MRSHLLLAISVFLLGFTVWFGFFKPSNKYEQAVLVSTPTPIPIVNGDKLFDLINDWRTNRGFSIYEKSELTCRIASQRLDEVKANFSHEGFSSERLCNDECSLAENLIKDRYSEQDSLYGWTYSPLHLENLEKNYTHSCVKCSNTPENICVHIFSYF